MALPGRHGELVVGPEEDLLAVHMGTKGAVDHAQALRLPRVNVRRSCGPPRLCAEPHLDAAAAAGRRRLLEAQPRLRDGVGELLAWPRHGGLSVGRLERPDQDVLATGEHEVRLGRDVQGARWDAVAEDLGACALQGPGAVMDLRAG
jgi:hypothetical protein